MNRTFNSIILVLFITFTNQLYSQIIEGKTFIYEDGVIDMSSPDGWKRVKINKGFINSRDSYINFQKNSIIINIGKTEKLNEIYLNLKPKYTDNFNKYTVFSDIPYMQINTVDSNNNGVDISYFESKYFNDKKGFLIFSNYKNRTMYIFKCNKNIDELITKLYIN